MSNTASLILLIDDEIVGLQIRRILLERVGYRVLTALDGDSGLRLFAHEPVDAAVVDFSLPGLSGCEIADRMKQTKPDVPILILSGYATLPAEIASSLAATMNKGEGAAALLERIRSMVEAPLLYRTLPQPALLPWQPMA